MDVVSGYQPAPLTQEERAELHNVILLATLPMEEPQTDVEYLAKAYERSKRKAKWRCGFCTAMWLGVMGLLAPFQAQHMSLHHHAAVTQRRRAAAWMYSKDQIVLTGSPA